MPDEKPEDRSETMEDDLHRLEDHIDEAKGKLADRKKDADAIVDDVAGEPEGEQDSSGGDDPSAGGDDEREADEVANPT